MPTISIGFNDTVELPKNVMISMEVPIQENEHIWVWDHYFAYVLNILSENKESAELMETLSNWSQNFAKNMTLSFNELSEKKMLTLFSNEDTNSSIQPIQIVSHLDDCSQLYFIEISSKQGHWPNVHIKIPDDANPVDLSNSVIALAEFFMNQNQHFYRDLPLHMLAMRKFYRDELHYADDDSINQAPAFAFDTAFKFIQHLENQNQANQ